MYPGLCRKRFDSLKIWTSKFDGFEVTQDENEPNKFYVYEAFDSEGAFRNHQQRVRGSQWGAVTRNIERHYQITGLNE